MVLLEYILNFIFKICLDFISHMSSFIKLKKVDLFQTCVLF